MFIKCSEKVALQALKASDWHLEGAFDVFYSQPLVKSYADTRHVEELYKRYKGKQRNSVAFLSLHPLLKFVCKNILVFSHAFVELECDIRGSVFSAHIILCLVQKKRSVLVFRKMEGN